MKSLLTIMFGTMIAIGAPHNPQTEYASSANLISYDLPSAWQVEGEHNLMSSGYLHVPYPVYTLIAGGEAATLDGVPNPPSGYAFSETPSPWFMTMVETGKAPTPSPENAYEIAPEGEMGLQQEEGVDPHLVRLTQPVDVSSRGLRGSEDRSEIIVPGAGDIEMNEVVYVDTHTVWITVVGCTVACYNANAATLSGIIDSVRVGTAAQY